MIQKVMVLRALIAFIVFFIFSSCSTPVLRKDFLERGFANPLLSDFVQSPDVWRNQLFILGGNIVSCRNTEEGSLIEAVYVSVNSLGYPQAPSLVARRFLAIYPVENGVLDPIFFRQGREITIAGVFLENRIGFIDDVSYTYPTFRIEEIYLWEQRSYYTYPHPPLIFSIGGFFSGGHWGVAPSFSFGW
jgi:starvation-inducible outer membrane lipoprotein